MKKIIFLLAFVSMASEVLNAQYRRREREEEHEEDVKPGMFFTGGSVSLAFYNNTFLIGGSPVFGYSPTTWLDAGVVVNYNYTSYRDVNVFDDKLRQSVYGGGVFTKLYPVRFLFAQAQLEHNFIRQKYFEPGISGHSTAKAEASSFLIGGGYTTGRYGGSRRPFFYLAVLFDVSDNVNSPYTDAYGRTIPIVRGGIQVPLGKGKER